MRLEKEGTEVKKSRAEQARDEEPTRCFIHGPPGTGKSKLIQWIRRLFEEALGWEHGVEFLFRPPVHSIAYPCARPLLCPGTSSYRDLVSMHSAIHVRICGC